MVVTTQDTPTDIFKVFKFKIIDFELIIVVVNNIICREIMENTESTNFRNKKKKSEVFFLL